MRALMATLALLSLLTFLPSPAAAQTQGAITVQLTAPEEPLSDTADSLSFTGVVILTTDFTAYASMSGIPVQYTVTKQPAWAIVTVSPASDVFYTGTPTGTTMVSAKAITVTVNLRDAPTEDVADQIEITATTAQATPVLGSSFTGKGTTPIVYDAPEAEPCPEHAALSNVDWASVAVEAADAYNARQGSADDAEGEEMSVQTGGASTLSMPWIIVGGFALIGAGVGLVLRRRFAS